MLELLFDWEAAFAFGTDVAIYLIMALAGTVLFVLRLMVSLFFGADADFDAGHDLDLGSDAAFSYLSLLSLLAFFMGAGWMGLACRIDFGWSGLPSAMGAATFGFGSMMLASGLMAYAQRLNSAPAYDLNTAVGRTARVYMSVPAKGEGRGQVEVDVSGARKVIEAVSNAGKLDQFTSVRVVEVRDDQTLVVEPSD